MSRLFIFLFGVLVGAAGVFYLFNEGRLSPRAPSQAIPAAADSSESVELPPPIIPAPTDVTPSPPAQEPFAPAQVAVKPMLAGAPASAPMPPPGSSALLIPVLGVKAEQLTDTYTQSRGEGRSHDAIDIMAVRGTPVVAVDDGKVVKLFTSKPGGLTVYQFDREEKLAYYYAHLDSYAPGVAEGKVLKRGDLVGYVGSTGNANPAAPHLHFAIFVLAPEKSWWKGTAINPYSLLGGHVAEAQTVGDATHAGPANN